MPQVQFNYSKDGLEVALSRLAFNVGRMAAAKCLGEINAEVKAAQTSTDAGNGDNNDSVSAIKASCSIDRFSELANDIDERENNDAHIEELGLDRPVNFVEWCVLFASINDELEKLSKPTKNGSRWPRPQEIESVLEFLVKVDPNRIPAVRDDDVAGIQAMAEAFSGAALPLEDAQKLAGEQARDRLVFFASLYEKYKDDIIDRIKAGVLNYNRFSETSFTTLFNNLPPKTRYNLLGQVDFALEDKCKELLTGKRRNGSASPVAGIPALVRASSIALIRGDQKQVKADRDLISLQLEAQAA